MRILNCTKYSLPYHEKEGSLPYKFPGTQFIGNPGSELCLSRNFPFTVHCHSLKYVFPCYKRDGEKKSGSQAPFINLPRALLVRKGKKEPVTPDLKLSLPCHHRPRCHLLSLLPPLLQETCSLPVWCGVAHREH